MTEEAIRLSDAEREAVAADLGEHFAQGRLTADEHAERVGRVWAARTRGEIAPIFRDLPSPYSAVASPVTSRADSGHRNRGFGPFGRGIPGPFLVLLAVLLVLSAVAHFPFLLLGLVLFAVLRHRGRPHCYGRHPRWR